MNLHALKKTRVHLLDSAACGHMVRYIITNWNEWRMISQDVISITRSFTSVLNYIWLCVWVFSKNHDFLDQVLTVLSDVCKHLKREFSVIRFRCRSCNN